MERVQLYLFSYAGHILQLHTVQRQAVTSKREQMPLDDVRPSMLGRQYLFDHSLAAAMGGGVGGGGKRWSSWFGMQHRREQQCTLHTAHVAWPPSHGAHRHGMA